MDQAEIYKTEKFTRWIDGLSDIRAKVRILVRIERLAQGNPGDTKSIGEGVSELRIDYGPGYRVYYTKIGPNKLVLLTGGSKHSQDRDIKTSLRLARHL